MNRDSKVYVAGHSGLVGSAIHRELTAAGYGNIVTRSSKELDLRDRAAVDAFYEEEKLEFVMIAAAKVGGIVANNSYPADFIRDNLAIQLNLIDGAYRAGVKRLLFLGSSCIYPKEAPQPIKEEYLLTGPLEPTNRPYAIAKIAGIEQCWAYNRQYGTRYMAGMPTNMYGPGDNYDLETSHVIPAIIRKMHEAKESGAEEVTLWGSGKPMREFLYSDDLGRACRFLMEQNDDTIAPLFDDERPPLINIGYGKDMTIRELVELVAEVVGCEAKQVWDSGKPDGTMKKLMDSSLINSLGWKPTVGMREGLRLAYRSFLDGERSDGR